MITDLAELRKMRTWRIKLTARPNAVSLARAYVKSTLSTWGYTEPRFQADAVLVVSELVTNSLVALEQLDRESRQKNPLRRRHLVSVNVRELGRALYIGVWDSITYIPEIPAMPSPDAIDGRGLPIVRELAVEAGVWHIKDPAIGGKIVYATLACPS